MRKRTLVAAFTLCLAVFFSGCKGPNLQDRMDDGAEILRLNLGVGPGLLANVQATRLLALGAGTYEARRFGFRNGHGWVWDERRYDTNLVIPIWGWEDVDSVLYGGMPVTQVRGDAYPSDLPWTIQDKSRGWLELSANAHLLFIGVDAGVDAGEFVDWLVGWVGLDPAGDDAWTGAPAEPHNAPPTPPPQNPVLPPPS